MPDMSRIYELRVDTSGVQTVFTYPEGFGYSGLLVYYYDVQRDEFVEYVNGYQVNSSEFTYQTLGRKKIWVSYGNSSAYYYVTTQDWYDLKIETNNVKKNYYQYADTFTTNGLSVSFAHFGYGDEREERSHYYGTNNYSVSVDGLVDGKFQDYGSKVVTVSATLGGRLFTKTYNITVNQLTLVSCVVDENAKTNYKMYDESLQPIQVVITYSNNTSETINATFDSILQQEPVTNGSNDLIKYVFTPSYPQVFVGNNHTYIEHTIYARDWSLDLDATNVRKNYYYETQNSIYYVNSLGGKIYNIDLTGLVAKKKWEFPNGNEYETLSNSSLTISRVGSSVNVTYTISGRTENNVKTASYEITISQKALTSILLGGDYKTVFGVNEQFTTNGLVVTGVYNDTTSEVIDGWTNGSVSTSSAGTQTVTISKTVNSNTVSNTYTITILGIKNVEVKPQKTTYYVGERFKIAQTSGDATDLIIWAFDENNNMAMRIQALKMMMSLEHKVHIKIKFQ